MSRRLAVVLAAALALAVPAMADAATRSVWMGTPASEQKAFQEGFGADVNAFFPKQTTINVGDTVRFLPAGFHDADFPRRGGDPLPLLVPTTPAQGVVDAAGAPFWFNGQPVLGFNPALLRPLFGRRVTYNGARRVNTGLPLTDRPRPAQIRFTRAGTFDYFCDVHAGMKGRVSVRPRRSRIPSARAHARAVARQVAADKRVARGLAAATPPANTVLLGNYGGDGVDYLGMLPQRLTVPVGTAVTFRMPANSREVHTATFAPGDAEQPATYLGSLVAGFEGPQIDPRASYPSEPPGTSATLTPTLHGNGFWNSGVLVAEERREAFGGQIPSSATVTFGAPGTYPFICLIHPNMKGEVLVQ